MLRPDRFTTYVATFPVGDGTTFQRRIWSYETVGRDAALYDVTHASDGRLRYRKNMGEWSPGPTSGVHDEIVRFYRIQVGENNGERLC